jgi:hypothetical protein
MSVEFNFKKHESIKMLIPKTAISDGKINVIKRVDPRYLIKGYVVETLNGYIDNVFVSSPHPNCDPNTNKFCIPNILRKRKFDKQTAKIIEMILITYNLDNCYFKPKGYEIEF